MRPVPRNKPNFIGDHCHDGITCMSSSDSGEVNDDRVGLLLLRLLETVRATKDLEVWSQITDTDYADLTQGFSTLEGTLSTGIPSRQVTLS